MKKLLIAFLIVASVALFGVKIVSVQFQGLKNVSKEELLTLVKPYLDKDYAVEELGSVITRIKKLIMDTGYFESLRVRLDEDDEGNQIVIFLVKEYPVLRKIEVKIEGVKLIDETEVASALNLDTGHVLRQDELRNAIYNVQKLYNEAGYFLVEIAPTLSEEGTLVVNVTEYALWDIVFKGADEKEIDLSEIKKSLGLSLLKDYYNTFWLFRFFLDKKKYYPKLEDIQRAMYKLSQYYYFEGFRLEPEKVKPEGVNEKVAELVFKVRLRKIIDGEKFIEKVEFHGNRLISSDELSKVANLSGRKVRNIEILKTAQKLLDFYSAKGYMMTWLETTYDSSVLHFDVYEKYIDDVVYQFISGDGSCTVKVSRYSTDFSYEGCEFPHTKKYLVDDLVNLERGNPLEQNKLVDVYGALNRSQYFEKVDIVPLTTKTSTAVSLLVKLKEKSKKFQIMGAVSYGPPGENEEWWEGFGGQLSLSTTNPWGKGQTISLNTSLLFTSKSVSISYSIPRPFLLPLKAGISLGYSYLGTTGSGTSLINLGTSISTLPFMGNTFSIAFSETMSFGSYHFGSLKVSHTFDNRDSALNPMRGFLITESLEKGGIFPSDSKDYYKVIGKIDTYFPIYGNFYVAFRTYGGIVYNVLGVEKIAPLPPDSVRGYSMYGEYLYKASAELRYSIYKSPVPVNLVAFYDIGSCARDFEGLRNFVDSAGVGLNFVLPMFGPMEVGLAYKPREDKMDIYFLLGFQLTGFANAGLSPTR